MADMDTIHTLLTGIAQDTAANGAKIDFLNDRLFGVSGVIPAIGHSIKTAQAEIVEAKAKAEKVNAKLNTQRAYVAGASAAGLAAGGVVKFVLGKMGLHF